MIEIVSREQVYRGYAKVERWQVKQDGQQRPVECVLRGQSVALLPYDPASDTVLLVRQFRPGAYPEYQQLLELIAGMIDPEESPLTAAVREAAEETGLSISEQDLVHIGRFYLSPGIMTETTDIFLCFTSLAQIDLASQGGLASEGESIVKVRMPLAELARQLASPGGHSVTLALACAQLQVQLAINR